MQQAIPTIKNIPYKSDLDKIEKVLNVYSTIKGIQFREFEKVILKYYLVYGYSKETKRIIQEDLGKKEGNIRVVDTSLREKGFLNKGTANLRKSRLSDDMEQIREEFIIKKKDVYLLMFKNGI